MNFFFKNNHHIHIYECLSVYAMLKPLAKITINSLLVLYDVFF